ncbi:hypothetical protein QTO30_04900 [Yoonia sp. GPGPB17]|uniref:hypothetical protein n=1 Tax=Yoonia sp. GPGPB17 TaxID=3026147 RepID=UPI0030C1F3C9
MTWTDKDLQAYLAGDADPDMAAAIETALIADTLLEDRLMALDPLASQIAGAAQLIAGPTDGQVDVWAQPPIAPPRMGRFGWRHMAVSAVIGVFAASAVWFVADVASEPDWRAEVATYQALYSAQTIANIAFDDAAIDQQIADLAVRTGFDDLRQVTDSIDNMQLLRGQILAFEGQPLAQIVFMTSDGSPVALCVIKKRGMGEDAAIHMKNRSGLASASFETAHHSWLLIGTQDSALIAGTARRVVAELASL